MARVALGAGAWCRVPSAVRSLRCAERRAQSAERRAQSAERRVHGCCTEHTCAQGAPRPAAARWLALRRSRHPPGCGLAAAIRSSTRAARLAAFA